MAQYRKVFRSFWIGETARALRGDPTAQLVAIYLITAPSSNMAGVYYLPVTTIAHELGIPLEGASKGLRRVAEGGLCSYDWEAEVVYVHNMARFQVGEALSAKNPQAKGLANALEEVPKSPLLWKFYQDHKDTHSLKDDGPWRVLRRPLEGASEAPRSQDQDQDQDQDQEHIHNARATPASRSSPPRKPPDPEVCVNGEGRVSTEVELNGTTYDSKLGVDPPPDPGERAVEKARGEVRARYEALTLAVRPDTPRVGLWATQDTTRLVDVVRTPSDAQEVIRCLEYAIPNHRPDWLWNRGIPPSFRQLAGNLNQCQPPDHDLAVSATTSDADRERRRAREELRQRAAALAAADPDGVF